MYTRVSPALREKIGNDLVEVIDYTKRDFGILQFSPEEMHLHRECVEWRECINMYFLTSYRGGSLKNFLTYEYIKPKKIFNNTVEFEYETNWNTSWRDWFIVDKEGNSNASSIIT